MLPVNSDGHPSYQKFLKKQIFNIFPIPSNIPDKFALIILQFYNLDLSDTDFIMQKCYSKFGPNPRLPSLMLRSYLLSIKLQFHSIDKWVNAMHINPLFAALSGFESDNIPGVGTFYDFFKRIWNSKNNNFFPHIRDKNPSIKKPEKSQEKASSVEKIIAEELIAAFKIAPPSENQPFSTLAHLFKKQFLDVSVQKGLIDLDNLTLAGDGTPLYTSARPRHKTLCNCKELGIKNCDCPRYYSQPDCNIGLGFLKKAFL